MGKLNKLKRAIIFCILLSFSSQASAWWGSNIWSWIKSNKTTAATVTAVTGASFFIYSWWKARVAEERKINKRLVEDKNKDLEEKKLIESDKERLEEKKYIRQELIRQSRESQKRLTPKEKRKKKFTELKIGKFNEYYKFFIAQYKNKLEEKSKKGFLDAVDKFTEKLKKEQSEAAWLGEKAPNAQKIQKINLPDDAEVKMFTDIHSCSKALKQFVGWMHFKGWTKEDDIFKITEKNLYLAFLGDYFDRGFPEEGINVLHIIMNLFMHNPEKVIVLRGNHEDYKVRGKEIYRRSFIKKDLQKDESSIRDYDKIENSKIKTIDHTFAIIPAMALLMNNKHCYMLSHASFDESLNIRDLLTSNDNVEYQKITNDQSFQIRWNDFSEKKSFIDIKKKGRSKFGKNYFINYCKIQTEDIGKKIVGFFRGHQHSNDKNFKHGGLWFLNEKKQWSGKTSEPINIEKLTKEEPFVLTIKPFRYSKYIGREGTETNNATIVTLKLNKDFSKCTISPRIMKRINLGKK